MDEIVGRVAAAVARIVLAIAVCLVAASPTAVAEPGNGSPPPDDQLIRPLPAVVPQPSNWVPKFPYPYNQTRNLVTDVDINMERELCQWYNAQYDTLIDQIDRLQFNRIQQFGPGVRIGSGTDWDYGAVQQQVDIVVANLDQADQFLAPRVQAFTVAQDFAGDNYFPMYQAQSFFLLWQNLANTNNGIKAHQPDWFTGPSVQFSKKAGSDINRSHVCR
jgi:hypothetical protein